MADNWLTLLVPYFLLSCGSVLDGYFAMQEFSKSVADPAGRVVYAGKGIFVEVSYWLEDAPAFAPMVAIGIDPGYLLISSTTFNRIGLWYAIPENVEARQYSMWRFSNAFELEISLMRIRDEVIDVYAKPLWLHPERLAALVERRYREVLASYAEQTLNKKRLDAEAAFNTGNYEQALIIYRDIGIDSLTPTERKRCEVASKRMRFSVVGTN